MKAGMGLDLPWFQNISLGFVLFFQINSWVAGINPRLFALLSAVINIEISSFSKCSFISREFS